MLAGRNTQIRLRHENLSFPSFRYQNIFKNVILGKNGNSEQFFLNFLHQIFSNKTVHLVSKLNKKQKINKNIGKELNDVFSLNFHFKHQANSNEFDQWRERPKSRSKLFDYCLEFSVCRVQCGGSSVCREMIDMDFVL